MTAADPTAGEDHWTCGAWGGCSLPRGHNVGQADVPENHPASPPAVAASTGTSEDAEALWSAIVGWTDDPTDEATEAVERIVAAREAAARAEERERIAQAIEAGVLPSHPNSGYKDGFARAARIAREADTR